MLKTLDDDRQSHEKRLQYQEDARGCSQHRAVMIFFVRTKNTLKHQTHCASHHTYCEKR